MEDPKQSTSNSQATEERLVSKKQATEEMGISLSTLDRRIGEGEIEVVNKGRRVYVKMRGPEPPSDLDRLEDTRTELAESKRTVSRLERSESELGTTVSRLRGEVRRLEGELDAVRGRESGLIEERNQFGRDYKKERAEHLSVKEELRKIVTIFYAGLGVSAGIIVFLLALLIF